jgi:hypothetical protein
LDEAEAARNPVESQRLTVTPAGFFWRMFLSRSSFASLAMRSTAKSSSPAPLGHSVPRFTG